jgi:hypothetical protein
MSETTKINPLTKHFRQPAIFLKLPSGGTYWPESALDLPTSGEIPIYPMTTRDEIILRTPDALLNGEGMVSVLEHCCPSIKDAWQMPSIDVDAVLIAIRIASYGQAMEVTTICPHCKNDNLHDIDLNFMLDSVKVPPYDRKVKIDDLEFTFKPLAYFEQNKSNRNRFDEQRLIQIVNDSTLTDDDKQRKFNEYMETLVTLNISVLAKICNSITTPDGIRVTDPDHILEFFTNAPGSTVKQIQKHVDELNQVGGLPKLKLSCEECEKPYESSMEFDYTSFFAVDS